FLVGALQTPSDGQLWIVAIGSAAAFIVLMLIAPKLNVALVGEAEAVTLGVRIHRLRWVGLVVASLLTAAVVAISGPIGFVGLICPHVARRLVGNDQRALLPVATGMGAALLALADGLARWLAHDQWVGTMLPVGIFTSLLGGPFFLMLLWQ